MKLPCTTLPILIVDGEAIQGSANIIDWAENQSDDPEKSLIPSTDLDKCLEVEKHLDEVAGVHARRFYYSEALMDSPAEVRQIFARDLTFFNKMALRGSWSMVRKLMIQEMDLGKEQREDSKKIIERELEWLDDMLSDGREFLIGGKFSRADLTAASLLAVIAKPKKHPVYNDIPLPPKMKADMETWQERPAIKWVNRIYSQYR
ncbi:MAG: hypothetical protein DHS20C13_03110 [Thermodesulfobacteriota bacterium]|nr:MAG: hypothetical protein DHS20C13_03110 [Thermodesulfobacteriota bacterium]